MDEILQNTLNDKQRPTEPAYTYSHLEQESEALQQVFFRLFDHVSNEATNVPS